MTPLCQKWCLLGEGVCYPPGQGSSSVHVSLNLNSLL